jgi:hypothetical protein
MWRFVVSLMLVVLAALPAAEARAPRPGAPQTSTIVFTPFVAGNRAVRQIAGAAFGADFITSAQAPANADRYAHAAQVRSAYDRIPLYWWAIETAPGTFDWAAHDSVIAADIAHGYQLDAILLMPPSFYIVGPCALGAAGQPRVGQHAVKPGAAPAQDCTTPANLDAPIFTDGTDVPGPGKTVNPNNYWARYVYRTVERYRPGGQLAQALGWGSGVGVRLWEIWNEPDWEFFWNGNAAGYARALKVAYIAAKQSDYAAQVIFGGLSNIDVQPGWPSGRPTWLNDVLAMIQADPDPALRNAMSWYFDGVGDHNYSWGWSSWLMIYTHNNVVASYGLTGKSVWLNETGVPQCDDYPGPPCPSSYRANLSEAASFEIESAAYALFVGMDGYLHFQLYDDCGAPYDAFGFFRNPASYTCNNGSPYPNTARPSVTAFNVAAAQFAQVEPLWRKRPGGPDPYSGPQEWIAFYRPATHQRVLAVWARFADNETAVITATGTSAVRIDQTGASITLTPVNGTYTVVLPGATNFGRQTPDGSAMIGGRPYVLVETDTLRPVISVQALPAQSPPQIVLTWTAEDLGSGLGNTQVWVSVDNRPLALWAVTLAQSATYTGQSGHRYGFAVRAVDKAGNWNPVAAAPQTTTYVP